jgi:hypothetical protein
LGQALQFSKLFESVSYIHFGACPFLGHCVYSQSHAPPLLRRCSKTTSYLLKGNDITQSAILVFKSDSSKIYRT